MALYEKLKELCRENGTSITALCVKITGGGGNLSTWKHNHVRADWLSAISDEFNVSVDYILEKTPVQKRFCDLSEDEQNFIAIIEKADPDFRRALLEVLKKAKDNV